MKKLILFFLAIISLAACQPSVNKQMEKAEAIFIDEVQYMTKEEALAEEIDYYKDPVITTHTHCRSLTGKNLIHECNRVIKEDNEKEFTTLGPTTFKTVRFVGDIKRYAIEHPDDIVANEFYFVGTFTHFGNGYDTKKAKIIYVPKIDQYIIDRIY